MMQRVRAAPAIKRRKGQHAQRAANPVIAGAFGKKRVMPAIMLDDEDAQQQQPRQRRKRKGDQIARVDGGQHG